MPGQGKEDSTILDAYSRDVLNENDRLLLCFTEDVKFALLNKFFLSP